MMAWATVIGTILSIGFYLLKRRNTKHDNPLYKAKQAQEEITTAVLKGDGVTVNLRLADMLLRLRNQKSGGSSGQNSSPCQSGEVLLVTK